MIHVHQAQRFQCMYCIVIITRYACTVLIAASQMWCMGRYLPLIVGDLIPEDNEYWQNFLLLLDIIDYIFAPTCNNTIVAYLHFLIEAHHMEFKRLYPENSIIPKMHYMIHYPEMITRYIIMIIQYLVLSLVNNPQIWPPQSFVVHEI